jgi:hypothetical protein
MESQFKWQGKKQQEFESGILACWQQQITIHSTGLSALRALAG